MSLDTNTAYAMPLLALRGMVVFPNNVATFDVARKKSINALKLAMETNQLLLVVTQKDFYVEEPGEQDLYEMGCVVKVKQVLKVSDNLVKVLVKGLYRGQLLGRDKVVGLLAVFGAQQDALTVKVHVQGVGAPGEDVRHKLLHVHTVAFVAEQLVALTVGGHAAVAGGEKIEFLSQRFLQFLNETGTPSADDAELIAGGTPAADGVQFGFVEAPVVEGSVVIGGDESHRCCLLWVFFSV